MFAMLLLAEVEDCRNKMRIKIQRRRLRDSTNPFEMPEERFRKLYRLSRDTAYILIQEMRPYMKQEPRKTFIPIPIRVCIALHFFASGSYRRDIGKYFSAAMSRTVISRVVAEVSSILQNNLGGKWILFPTEEEYPAIKQRFLEATGFPGVIGALDCTHVRIAKPNPEVDLCYRNNKGYYSKNVQLISDFDLRIFGVYARFGGDSEDSYIWECSQINARLERGYEACEPEQYRSWLLGHCGYPLRPWLMTPYRAPADADERNFNTIHAKAQNCVKRLSGILKGVFRCLKLGLCYTPQDTGKIINACCVLHNFRVKHRLLDDFTEDPESDDGTEDPESDDVIEDPESDEEDDEYHESNSVHHRAALVIRDRLKRNLVR